MQRAVRLRRRGGGPSHRLTVAKTHQVKVTVWTENGVDGGDVAGAGIVVEYVEQPAVEDRVEGLAERIEAHRVEHLEGGIDPPLSGLALGDLDRARGDVDAKGVGTAKCSENRVLASPAARVEEGAGERIGVGEAEKNGLRAADVPRRQRADVGAVPVVMGWAGCGHGSILSDSATKAPPPQAGGRGHFEKGSSSTALRSIKVSKEQALRHCDEQRDLWNVVGSWGDHTLDARRP